MFLWRRVAPQSPEAGLKPTATPGYARNFRDLNRLISEGNSFSGYERNPFFLNLEGKGFSNVADLLGIDFDDDARAVASVDWDHDGDLDLWVTNRTSPRVRLLRNNQPIKNNSISFRLVGNGTTTNCDGIGARLSLWPEGQPALKQIRTVRAGGGFLAQSSARLHCGLGNFEGKHTATIAWPGGGVETFKDLEPRKNYQIRQGGIVTEMPRRRITVPDLSKNKLRDSQIKPGLWLAHRLPFPKLTYTDGSGVERSSDEFPGQPVLVNFWATWCEPCVWELTGFAGNADALRASGASVLALNVDGLAVDGGTESVGDAQAQLLRLGFDFPSGAARAENLGKIETLIEMVTSRRGALRIPSSFLVDAKGRVAAIYEGSLSWAQLRADLALLDAPPETRLGRLPPRPGRWIENPLDVNFEDRLGDYATRFATNGFSSEAQRIFTLRKSEDPRELYNRAKAAMAQRRISEAKKLYQAAIAADPKFGQALTGLGALFLMEKRPDLAQPLFEQALAIDPNHATALINLAMIDQSRGDQASALEKLQRVVDLNPDFAAARFNLGSLYASMKNYPKAIEHLEKGIRLDPRQPAAQLNLGSVFLKTQQWTEAEKYYEAVSKSHPRIYHAYLGLGAALAGQDRHRKAVEAFQKVLGMGVKSARAQTGLARSLLALGEKEAATKAVKIALEIDPNDPAAKDLRQKIDADQPLK